MRERRERFASLSRRGSVETKTVVVRWKERRAFLKDEAAETQFWLAVCLVVRGTTGGEFSRAAKVGRR